MGTNQVTMTTTTENPRSWHIRYQPQEIYKMPLKIKENTYPAPPLRKHQPGQESDRQTWSWCLDKAVQPRDTRYQKKACPENLPIPHPNHNSRNRAVLVGLWGMGATLGAPNFNSSVSEFFPRVERPMKVAGACSPVDRMYVTAKPGVTTLVMAENHTKTKSSGGQ